MSGRLTVLLARIRYLCRDIAVNNMIADLAERVGLTVSASLTGPGRSQYSTRDESTKKRCVHKIPRHGDTIEQLLSNGSP